MFRVLYILILPYRGYRRYRQAYNSRYPDKHRYTIVQKRFLPARSQGTMLGIAIFFCSQNTSSKSCITNQLQIGWAINQRTVSAKYQGFSCKNFFIHRLQNINYIRIQEINILLLEYSIIRIFCRKLYHFYKILFWAQKQFEQFL